MNRLIFGLAMMAAMFGLYRCALQAPATSKYQPALVQAVQALIPGEAA